MNSLPLAARMHVGMKGFIRVQTRNARTMKVRIDTGFFPNKLLTAGMNVMNTQASWLTHCHVGTNSTPPQASDTSLLGFVAATSNIVEDATGQQASAPFYGWRRKTFRFSVGAGHGGENLSEAGVGWGASGSTLVSRALIIDPITQNPTTITPLADELLDITYELRYYPPLVDATNSVTLDAYTYDTVTRAAVVTDAIWSGQIGMRIGKLASQVTDWIAYDGSIGTIEQYPNGTTANCDNATQYNETYQNNSFQIVMVSTCGINGWNLGAGIRCLRVLTTAGAYQTQFTRQGGGGETVDKDNLKTMVMKWVLSWGEYV